GDGRRERRSERSPDGVRAVDELSPGAARVGHVDERAEVERAGTEELEPGQGFASERRALVDCERRGPDSEDGALTGSAANCFFFPSGDSYLLRNVLDATPNERCAVRVVDYLRVVGFRG